MAVWSSSVDSFMFNSLNISCVLLFKKKMIYFDVIRYYFRKIGIGICDSGEPERPTAIELALINLMLFIGGPFFWSLFLLYIFHNKNDLEKCLSALTLHYLELVWNIMKETALCLLTICKSLWTTVREMNRKMETLSGFFIAFYDWCF